MSRRRLALMLRDLSAAAAFGSMAVSGELPIWGMAIFGVALAVALLDLRPLAKAATLSGIALAAGALGLYASVAAGGLDLVVAACSFAALLTAHRMLSASTPRTDGQVLLTSLLMIAGGAALSGELLFAFFLLGFGLLAMPSMALAVMERSLGNDVSYPLAPMMRRLSVGAVAAMIGAAIFFIAFPRLSWNVAARRPSRGLGAVSGISDGVRLGASGGEIKLNPRVVARIELSPDPKKEELDAYWVVATYGTWTGREWKDDTLPGNPRPQITLGDLDGREIRQRIELLPAYGSPMAVALETPVLFSQAASFNAGGGRRAGFVHAPHRDVRFADGAPSHTYLAASRPVEAVTSAPLDEETLARYRALPEVDPRVAALAKQIIGDTTDALEAAIRLEGWLRKNLSYSLELPESDGDPLAQFLFERKAGHCEYFASALAVMLRTQGFASRVATGFFGGERIEDGYVLRAGDAHAWVQVWVPGRGFMSLDATPPAGRGAQPRPWLDWMVRAWDHLDALWRADVLDYSMRDQARAVMKVIGSGSRSRLQGPNIPRNAWIAAGVAALIVYAVWRVRGLKRDRGEVGEATLLREQTERVLAEAQVVPGDGEGLEELRKRLVQQGHPLATSVDALTRRYLEARFGTRPLRAGERAHLVRRFSEAVATFRRAA